MRGVLVTQRNGYSPHFLSGTLPQPPPPSSFVSASEGLRCEPRRAPSSPFPSPYGSVPPLPVSSPGNSSPMQGFKGHPKNTKHVTVSHITSFPGVEEGKEEAWE